MTDTPRKPHDRLLRLSATDPQTDMSADFHAYFRLLARRNTSHAGLIEEADLIDDLMKEPDVMADPEFGAGIRLARIINLLLLAATPAHNATEIHQKSHFLLREPVGDTERLLGVILDAALVEDALDVGIIDARVLMPRRTKRD